MVLQKNIKKNIYFLWILIKKTFYQTRLNELMLWVNVM